MEQNEPVIKEQPKQVSRFRWLRRLVLIIVILVVVIGLFLFFTDKKQIGPFSSNSSLDNDSSNVPQFIQADFIDLDKISYISKFRSGSGHDFSGNGEQFANNNDQEASSLDFVFLSGYQGRDSSGYQKAPSSSQ